MDYRQPLVAEFMSTVGQWDGTSVLSHPQPKDDAELATYKLRLKLTLEETFDDFSKRAARNDRFVFFLFQLHEDPFFTYPNLDVGRVYAESVPIDSVKFAVKELIKYRNQYF